MTCIRALQARAAVPLPPVRASTLHPSFARRELANKRDLASRAL